MRSGTGACEHAPVPQSMDSCTPRVNVAPVTRICEASTKSSAASISIWRVDSGREAIAIAFVTFPVEKVNGAARTLRDATAQKRMSFGLIVITVLRLLTRHSHIRTTFQSYQRGSRPHN